MRPAIFFGALQYPSAGADFSGSTCWPVASAMGPAVGSQSRQAPKIAGAPVLPFRSGRERPPSETRSAATYLRQGTFLRPAPDDMDQAANMGHFPILAGWAQGRGRLQTLFDPCAQSNSRLSSPAHHPGRLCILPVGAAPLTLRRTLPCATLCQVHVPISDDKVFAKKLLSSVNFRAPRKPADTRVNAPVSRHLFARS